MRSTIRYLSVAALAAQATLLPTNVIAQTLEPLSSTETVSREIPAEARRISEILQKGYAIAELGHDMKKTFDDTLTERFKADFGVDLKQALIDRSYCFSREANMAGWEASVEKPGLRGASEETVLRLLKKAYYVPVNKSPASSYTFSADPRCAKFKLSTYTNNPKMMALLKSYYMTPTLASQYSIFMKNSLKEEAVEFETGYLSRIIEAHQSSVPVALVREVAPQFDSRFHAMVMQVDNDLKQIISQRRSGMESGIAVGMRELLRAHFVNSRTKQLNSLADTSYSSDVSVRQFDDFQRSMDALSIATLSELAKFRGNLNAVSDVRLRVNVTEVQRQIDDLRIELSQAENRIEGLELDARNNSFIASVALIGTVMNGAVLRTLMPMPLH